MDIHTSNKIYKQQSHSDWMIWTYLIFQHPVKKSKKHCTSFPRLYGQISCQIKWQSPETEATMLYSHGKSG